MGVGTLAARLPNVDPAVLATSTSILPLLALLVSNSLKLGSLNGSRLAISSARSICGNAYPTTCGLTSSSTAEDDKEEFVLVFVVEVEGDSESGSVTLKAADGERVLLRAFCGARPLIWVWLLCCEGGLSVSSEDLVRLLGFWKCRCVLTFVPREGHPEADGGGGTFSMRYVVLASDLRDFSPLPSRSLPKQSAMLCECRRLCCCRIAGCVDVSQGEMAGGAQ